MDEEIEVSSDEEIEAVSPPVTYRDNILSFDPRRGTVNGVPFPGDEGEWKDSHACCTRV